MAAISRRALAGAVAARLNTITAATVYYGQVGRLVNGTLGHQPPTKSATDLRVKPYVVLYPGAGGDGPDEDLAQSVTDLTLPHQVTAVAGDVDDLLALVDRVDALLLKWAPTFPGLFCGPLTRLPGAGAPLLTDTTQDPPRLYVPLQYVHTTTS